MPRDEWIRQARNESLQSDRKAEDSVSRNAVDYGQGRGDIV